LLFCKPAIVAFPSATFLSLRQNVLSTASHPSGRLGGTLRLDFLGLRIPPYLHACLCYHYYLFSFNEESLHGSSGGYQAKQSAPSALPAKEFLLPRLRAMTTSPVSTIGLTCRYQETSDVVPGSCNVLSFKSKSKIFKNSTVILECDDLASGDSSRIGDNDALLANQLVFKLSRHSKCPSAWTLALCR
jgi:hypothetical protein